MRFSQLFTLLIIFTTISCEKNQKGDLDKLKTDLDKLKLERTTLDKEISVLEAEYDKQNPKKLKATSVYVETVELQNFEKYLKLQGKVDAKNNVLANARTPGVVTRIVVSNGQRVGKGQVLAYLDDNVLAQGIKEADVQIAFARDLYNRQNKLWSQDIGTQVQLATAKNNYDSAIKRKNSLLSQKELYLVKSPISGIVDNLTVKVGEMMSPGSPLGIRVVNDKNLKILAEIGEGYLSSINSGDKVSVNFPDVKDSIQTRVSYVSRTIDEINRSFRLEINLPYNSKLKPNMLAELKIASYTNPKVIVVNFGVIQNDSTGDYIMVIRQGKLTKARIRKGESYNGKIEILDGLLINDQIITAGFEGLQEIDEVKIVATP